MSSAAAAETRGRLLDRIRVLAQAVAGIGLGVDLSARGVEHLHVHFANACATVGMYASRFAGIPFSVTAHANDIYERPELLRAKLARATPFITISEANRTYLRARYGASADRVEIVHCGVDTQEMTPAVRPESKDAPRILTVARLVPKKGLKYLLRALARLRECGLACTLDVAGDTTGLVEHQRVHDTADVDVDIRGAQPLQMLEGTRTADLDRTDRRRPVDETDVLA